MVCPVNRSEISTRGMIVWLLLNSPFLKPLLLKLLRTSVDFLFYAWELITHSLVAFLPLNPAGESVV